MIGYLKGILLEKRPDHVLVYTAGVGYEVEVPASSLCLLPKQNETVSLYILTHVREDSFRLFGFISYFDKLVFDSLLQVSGIGPKAALALLGGVDGLELCDIIAHNQLVRLTSIPGIGAKTAERLVLELKTKLQKLAARYEEDKPHTQVSVTLFEEPTLAGKNLTVRKKSEHLLRKQMTEDLKSALLNLGYKEKQLAPVVDYISQKIQSGEELSFELALKQSLKKLSDHVFKN